MRSQLHSESKLFLVLSLTLLTLPLGCEREQFDGVFVTMADNTFSPRENPDSQWVGMCCSEAWARLSTTSLRSMACSRRCGARQNT